MATSKWPCWVRPKVCLTQELVSNSNLEYVCREHTHRGTVWWWSSSHSLLPSLQPRSYCSPCSLLHDFGVSYSLGLRGPHTEPAQHATPTKTYLRFTTHPSKCCQMFSLVMQSWISSTNTKAHARREGTYHTSMDRRSWEAQQCFAALLSQ